MNVDRLLEEHGVLLEAARGPVPSVAELVAGEPIRGSWWAHPAAHEIFHATRALRDAPDVLVCRLVAGKVTFVHRRLWPAVIRLLDRLGHGGLAQIHEEHSAGGRHVVHEVPFPYWVSDEVMNAAMALSEHDAISASILASIRPSMMRDDSSRGGQTFSGERWPN